MSHTKSRSGVFSAVFLLAAILVLILDAQTAAAAAGEGIRICLQTVIPSLFPFFVLSKLFVASSISEKCSRLCAPVMKPLFGLSPACAPALVLGMLGGYPIGAKTAAELYAAGRITRQEAERLLSFCSNAGPAFLFGMLGGILGSAQIAAALYCIHLLSAVLTGFFLRQKNDAFSPIPPQQKAASLSLPEAVSASIRSMAQVCAYIVLFSVLSAFVCKWMPAATPSWMQVLLTGLLELSGGCCRLSEVSQPTLRLLLAALFTTFGGLCVWLQTQAVIAPAGLTGRRYLAGKLLQCAIALLLTLALFSCCPQILPTAAMEAPSRSHAGLLRSVGVVTAVCTVTFGGWCAVLQKKAGKNQDYSV